MPKKGRKEETLRVDIACGQRKQPGFVGVDCVKMPGVDIVHDLEKYPWPFKDNSVDEIYVSHYLEHVSDIVKFMNEVYRILKMDGKAKIIGPYYNSIRCWQDPTHKQAVSEASFFYFYHEWMKLNGLDHYGIKCNFKIRYEFFPNQEFMLKNKMAFEGKQVPDWPSVGGMSIYFPLPFALRYMTNAIDDIIVFMEKKPMDWRQDEERPNG